MTATVCKNTLRYFRRKRGSGGGFRRKAAVVSLIVLAIVGFFVVNWIYHAVRKPVEFLTPVSASQSKSPESTWQAYGSLFEKYSTDILSPEFLAALAQSESDGNPIARTYWRWRWSWNLFDIYRPASSALGMFQITDGTFAEARKYCIRDHKVVGDGPWYDLDSCWFSGFYTRTFPSHATELTAAHLHRNVLATLALRPKAKVTPVQKERLAAVIHLCGPRRGESYAKRGFRASAGEKCGAQSLRGYLTKVDRMKREFVQLRKGATPSENITGPVSQKDLEVWPCWKLREEKWRIA